MSSSLRSRVAWSLCAISILLVTASWVLGILREIPGEEVGRDVLQGLVLVVSFSILGALIASRQPGNRLAWIFIVIGSSQGLVFFGNQYSKYAVITRGSLPLGAEVAWLSEWGWIPSFTMLLTFVPLLVPDGHLLSPRWRWAGWASGIGMGTGVLLSAIGSWSERADLLLEVPESSPPPAAMIVLASAAGLMVLGAVGSIASLIIRYRRSKGQERLQLKWVVYAGALVVVIGTVQFFGPSPAEVVLTLVIATLPVSAGIAIFKYRLYDIDVVINKTVVYGVLAAFITAVYAGVVVGIGALVGAGDEPNLGLSLAATAIVAVAFQPVRQRVQRFANKLVYGERVTPYEAVTSFSHRMAESLSLDKILPQMAEAAARGVGGTRSRVRLFLPGGGEQVVNWPPDSLADSFDRSLEVVHQAEVVGEIAVAKGAGEQFTKSEEKLLSDLASQAGLAMRNLRLTGELQQKLVELQESRKRIVAAQDEERRRMERDIHDGAQQQLVSMAVKLGLAKNILPSNPQKASALLGEVKQTNDEAVETLRDLARGLFSQILTDKGLGAALASHVGKMGVDAVVDDQIGETRFDLEVEANIYFCIREALQNATKYAPGAPTVITLRISDGDLLFSVKDQGPGFDRSKVKAGSGLQNMADRVEALGGTLEIMTRPGVGTEVRGRLPSRSLEPAP